MAENIVQSALSKVRQTANQILRPVQQATQDTRGFVQQGRFTPIRGAGELLNQAFPGATTRIQQAVTGQPMQLRDIRTGQVQTVTKPKLFDLGQQLQGFGEVLSPPDIGLQTKQTLTPIIGAERAGQIGYGLQGATSYAPSIFGRTERASALATLSAPTTESERTAVRIGQELPFVIGSGAFGGLRGILSRGVQGTALGVGMQGVANVATGQEFFKDIGKAATEGALSSWKLALTNALTDKIASRFTSLRPLTSKGLETGGKVLKSAISMGSPQAKKIFANTTKRLFQRALLESPIENTVFTTINQMTGQDKRTFTQAWLEDLAGTTAGNLLFAGLVTGKRGVVDFNRDVIDQASQAFTRTTRRLFTDPEFRKGFIAIPEVPGISKPSTEGVKPAQGVTSAPSAQLVTRGGAGGLPPTPPRVKLPTAPEPFDTQRYITEQTQKQQAQELPTPTKQKINDFVNGVRVRLEDSTFYITKLLNEAEKKYNFRVAPISDVRLQIDRALRTDSLASQFVKDNNLDKIIQQVPDTNAFNQYLIAKQASRVSELGKTTGRNIEADKRLVQELQTTYEPFAQQVRTYNNNLLQYAVDSGMVSKELADKLRSIYPDYVPLKRVLDEVQPGVEGKGQAIASVSTNKVLQRLKGSEKAIRNPIESIVENTATVFAQGERNKAAKMIYDYRNIPDNPFSIRELAPGEKIGSKSTISFFDNGTKRTFEVNKDVAEAAKNLNKEQMNIYGKILSIPTRVLKIGTVGFNAPFILTNLVRDQATASIFGSKPLSTSLANPGNFLRAFYSVFKQDELYDNWVRNAGSFTSMDIARESVAPTVAKIRAGRSLPSKIAYTAKNPAELFRAVEDFVGKAEEITRLQQYSGTYNALIREGRSVADAEVLAAKAARENTANFARSGAWGQVLNGAIPFFNARVQGTRALRESFMRDPKGFTTRFMFTIGGPVATATIWNISDPQRRAAYEDIQEFEKENNLIILPPVPEQDENGRWKAIKIPMAPGLSNIASTIRRPIEGTQKLDLEGFRKLATDFLTVTTSVDLSSPNKTVGEILPQAIKPLVEAITNVNLFTGRPIVPTYMQGLPPSEQARENTSGTAREIGKLLNMSPIMVENMIRTMAGGVGSQLLNLSDQIMFRSGAIPQEQVGGENAFANIIRRFSLASGGVKADAIYNDIQDEKAKKQVLNNDLKLAVASGADQTALQLASSMTPNQAIDVLRSKNEKEVRDTLTSTQKALQAMTKDQREQYVATRPELQKDLLAVQAAEIGTQGVGGAVVQQLLVQNAMQELSPVAPTSPYQKITWERDVFSKIGSIEQREGIAKADKDGAIDQLLGKIGLSRTDYDYYKVAKENNEIKTAYVQEQIGNIVRQGGGPQQVYDFLANNQLSVRGNKIVTSGVLKELVDAGIITDNQSDQLKKLEVTGSAGNLNITAKAPKRRKLRARKPRVGAVKSVRLKQVKLPKAKAIKLTPIKPVRFAKLKAPKTSRRAKLQTIRVRS